MVLTAPILAESGSVRSSSGITSCLSGMVTLRPWMGISRELEEVVDLAGLQREVDGVDGLAAEGGVHHQRRERAAESGLPATP
jgi:hypothetical protein